MSFFEHMIQRFDAGRCVIGFLDSGTLVVDRYTPTDRDYFPVADAIQCLQDPTNFASFVERARSGDMSASGHYEGVNVAGLTVTPTGVSADLDLPDDSYTDAMTFEEFAPILAAWKAAWAAAQRYKMA